MVANMRLSTAGSQGKFQGEQSISNDFKELTFWGICMTIKLHLRGLQYSFQLFTFSLYGLFEFDLQIISWIMCN